MSVHGEVFDSNESEMFAAGEPIPSASVSVVAVMFNEVKANWSLVRGVTVTHVGASVSNFKLAGQVLYTQALIFPL